MYLFSLLDALLWGFDFSVMTQSPSVRVLVSLVVILGMFSSSIQTASAVTASTSTDVVTLPVPIITTTTTVQTDNDDAADTDDVIQEIPTASTSPARLPSLRTYTVDSTAYTSTVEECDDSPFITADGSHVADGIVAANFLPFGTKIRLPTIYGDRIFEVHDRMNKRYWYRVDIWMNNGRNMRQYGIKRSIPLEVVEWGTGETQWKKLAAANKK